MPRKRKTSAKKTSKVTKKKVAKRTKRAADHTSKKVTKKAAKKPTKRKAEAGEASASVEDEVLRISEIDALRFGKLDAEIRNNGQGMQLIELQIAKLQAQTQEQIKQLRENREQLKATMLSIQPQYNALVQGIADQLGIKDASKMVINPDTRIVRDLTKE